MKIKPYIFAGVGGNPMKTYFIRDGNAEVETFPGGRSSIPLSGAEIEVEKSVKTTILGLGTIKITGAGGSIQEWTNVLNVDRVYKALKRAAQGLPPEEFETEKEDLNKSKLETAKKTRKTDFGIYEDNSASIEDTTIETPVGTYILHHNGTFSDVENKLMWIQSPWGRTWDGNEFKGEPIGLYWKEATKLFGRRIYKNSRVPKTYKNGICIVTFAGNNDWRLPTARELSTLKFHPSDLGYDHSYSKQLQEKLFPTIATNLKQAGSDIWCWSADSTGDYDLAYACHGPGYFGDDSMRRKGYILLVRNF